MCAQTQYRRLFVSFSCSSTTQRLTHLVWRQNTALSGAGRMNVPPLKREKKKKENPKSVFHLLQTPLIPTLSVSVRGINAFLIRRAGGGSAFCQISRAGEQSEGHKCDAFTRALWGTKAGFQRRRSHSCNRRAPSSVAPHRFLMQRQATRCEVLRRTGTRLIADE